MKAFIVLLILINSAVLFAQTVEFSFDKRVKNYKVIDEGDTLKGFFIFKNKGSVPLRISNYSVECHCTEVFFPATETQPMQSDTIFFTFDSSGKAYQQDRSIILKANTETEMDIIRFKVYVNPKEEKMQSIFKR